MTRTISHRSVARNYLIISAYGIVLLFTSDQAILLATAPYPSFGLPTVTFMGLSAYMLLVGFYSSAISVAQDQKLRESIKKFTIGQKALLDAGDRKESSDNDKKVS